MEKHRRFSAENLPGTRVCLLSHYAAVNHRFDSTLKILNEMGVLHSILGPQHGFWGETQDNMIEWSDSVHPRFKVPVYSLYSSTRTPTDAMLAGADCVVVDLADVGTRYYTYIYSMALTMRKCAELDIPVAVIDRPNPLGNVLVEGPILDMSYQTFVGMYPIPVRHGLSIGELALFFAEYDGLPAPRILTRKQGEFAWVMPSPNMPTLNTALVYPGMCLLEATNLSEGRGTTSPFEIFGAPWIDPWELCDSLNSTVFFHGAVLRPHFFIPTFNKHQGVKCGGAQIHVLDQEVYRPFLAGLGILGHCFKYNDTCWLDPPYEYEYEKMPIDILAGGAHVRKAVDDQSFEELAALSYTPEEQWRPLDGIWKRFRYR